MARIIHPRPQLGRAKDRIGGIEFIDGVAQVDLSDKPNLVAAYNLHGYTVEPEVAEAAAEIAPLAGHNPDEALDSLTVAELRDLADEAGIAAKSGWNKADYVNALADHLEHVIAGD